MRYLILGLKDFLDSFKLYEFWLHFAMHDVKMRYRRSVLGPFWITLTTLITLTALGFLYAGMFKMEVKDYIPYLGLGLIFWGFISTSINESTTMFIDNTILLKQLRVPFFVYSFRVVTRNLIILFHNMILLIPLYIFFKIDLSLSSLIFFLFNLIIIFFLFVMIGIFTAIFSTRFRDIPPMIGNILQVVFFLTPVIWMPDAIIGRKIATYVLDLNPFNHILFSLRGPFLSYGFFDTLYILALSLIFVCIALFYVGKYKDKIIFWL